MRDEGREPDTSVSRDDLLRGCARGEEGAWQLFLDRYADLIWSVALRTGASHSDAEEIFQSSLLAIYEGLGRLKEPDRIVAWIAGITRRQSLYYFRKRSREVAESEEGLPDVADPGPSTDETMGSLERGQRLHEALGDLRARCRELLTALYLSDSEPSYQVIVDRLGIPIGSIGPTRARCLDALRRALESRESGG